jgi:hypothetical protein
LGDLQQTKQNTFLLDPHLEENQKEETKLQNPEPPAHTSFSTPLYNEKTGRLPHCQTLAPNLPRRHIQTGLDAEGVILELLRLKFYCSYT